MAKAAKKTSKTTAKRARPAGQRDLIRHGSRSAYAKRTDTGQFTELDDVGRSQRADRRVKAKRVAKAGFGDQGDQETRRSTRKGVKKTARKGVRKTTKKTAKRTAKKR